MSRTSKSQWDFGGELFPAPEMRRVFSVTEITGTVRRLLEEHVGTVWVTGEVSNLRAQSSGHIYFSIKDANSQLSCVCFRDDARGSRQWLEDGRKVVLKGDVTVYEARGQYQLIVKSVELEGVGALQLAFEKLKQKLAAEGLFAPERKRPVPDLVHRLGLVTSPTGAALRDVLHVIERRHPGLEIILAPCRVQGQGAAGEIAAAIRMLNEWSEGPVPKADSQSPIANRHPALGNLQSAIRNPQSAIDLILITRGGGSLEDLWAFNEEAVARAIFDSRVPVISAVGHEIDFTIADFVADLRAATPSAAAELLTEGMMRRREWVTAAAAHLLEMARAQKAAKRDQLQRLAARLARAHPRRQLHERGQRLDDLQTSLVRSTKKEWRRHQLALWNFAQRLARVKPSRSLELHRQRLREMETRLRLLSPEQVLGRGFSITRDAATGAVVRDVSQVQPGQKLRTQLSQGEITSTAEAAEGGPPRRKK